MGLSVGTKLGVYEVIEPIGSGGMGEVFLNSSSPISDAIFLSPSSREPPGKLAVA